MTNATNAPPAAATTPPASAHHILVLLVDDQPVVGEAVRRALLDQPDIELHVCSDCHRAADIAKAVKPTVILQDLVMPGINGLDLVRQYRADSQTSHIPIIVLSTKEEAVVKRDAFRLGANDYLVKLPDRIELIARLRYHSAVYRTQIERDEAYRALRESQQQLIDANLELQKLTNVDGLTGLSNKRYFGEYMEA
ncbi:MAG: response regulator, partial [Microvirga sp.]